MMGGLPGLRAGKTERVHIADLGQERLVLVHREGAPGLFDTITGMCNDVGFSPKVENEPNMMQTVLSLVEAEEGVSIVPACVRNLRSDGVCFCRLQPDDVRVELIAAWKKETLSVVLPAFLDLIDANTAQIRKEAELC